MNVTDVIEMMKVAGDLIGKVGVPAAMLGYILWRIEPRLDRLIAAVQEVSDPDKTAARFKAPLDEQARHIIHEVDHNTRGAIAHLSYRRDNGA